MSREASNQATHTGTIERVLPREMFLVRLDDGRSVRVGVPPSAKHSLVRIIEGNRVQVRLSNHDPGRGQLLKKL